MHTPSGPEISMFLVVLGASLGLFLQRFVPVAKTILNSPKEPGFQLDPMAKRFRDFVWEVLLQAKVIKERPLPGIAHAFVFWGFGALALVTINHFAEGFGLELISPTSRFGQFYFGLATVFALLVIVSIVGLAFRRFVVRPKWLGKVALEWGFVGM